MQPGEILGKKANGKKEVQTGIQRKQNKLCAAMKHHKKDDWIDFCGGRAWVIGWAGQIRVRFLRESRWSAKTSSSSLQAPRSTDSVSATGC